MNQRVGSNTSGGWQKGALQNPVRGEVFLGPVATVPATSSRGIVGL